MNIAMNDATAVERSYDNAYRLPEAPRHPSVDQHSAVIRKQLDWVAEAAHRIFADAFEIEIAFDEVGERARQQHRFPQLFGEGFKT